MTSNEVNYDEESEVNRLAVVYHESEEDEHVVNRPVPKQSFSRPDPEESAAFNDALGVVENDGKGTSMQKIVFIGEEGNPTVSTFKDHFTLAVPSSVIRYRNSTDGARVIETTGDFQYILEEKYNKEEKTREITIRAIQETGPTLRLLRLTYTVVTAFWTGFLFVFAMQILLFLFLDLAITMGITTDADLNWFGAAGAILGALPLINGLASTMVIAGAFVMDTWRGHMLVREFTFKGIREVTMEWIFFAFFLGLPLFVMCCTLLSRTDDWWAITGMFWLFSIGAFFCIFAVNVIFYEMRASSEVMKNQHGEMNRLNRVKRLVLLRQIATYGGRMQRTYLSRGTIEDSEFTDKSGEDNIVKGTLLEWKDWLSWLSMHFVQFGWFEKYENPVRLFSVDDARDVRPFITSHTWSLEKVFCRPRNSRYIAIIKGSGAVTRAQMKSSIICSLIGSFLVFFVIFAVMVYLQAGAAATGFMLAIAIIISIPNFKNTYRLYKVSKDIIHARTVSKSENGKRSSAQEVTHRDLEDLTFSARDLAGVRFQASDSEGLYLVDETFRLTRPSDRAAWVFFWMEIIFLFLWPVISLFAVGNWPLALIYVIIAGVTTFRYYINAAIVLEEVGHMDLVDGKSERELWKNQSRLNIIVGNISRGTSKRGWVYVISVFAFAFLALFAGAIGTDQEQENIEDPTYTYLPDFEYKPVENSLRYPTCQMTDPALQESPLTAMADYIFLARVAYRGNITQRELDDWFGDGVAIDQADIVRDYRQRNNINSQVSFKLITYPGGDKDFAYMTIRGTTNQWEALTDAQLWSAAILFQVLREILPFGSIWTPVIPYLVSVMTGLQSESIDDISFYKDTTTFATWLKDGKNYSGVTVTGHSLGGGLSMITGAISKIPSVALSGPNTMLTRRSIEPQLTTEDLDRYTFNIRPARDVVPMFDDTAQNYQNIRCNADFTDIIGCHDTTRALCEVIYTCGTNGRPALCECVTQMGYPEPQPIDPDSGITFAEACGLGSDR